MIESKIEYTKDYLLELDEKLEMVPLIYDQMLKRMFLNNPTILKRFLISVLKINVRDYFKIKVTIFQKLFNKKTTT